MAVIREANIRDYADLLPDEPPRRRSNLLGWCVLLCVAAALGMVAYSYVQPGL